MNDAIRRRSGPDSREVGASTRRLGLVAGVVAALASALLTGGMLFVNGSFVLALITVMAENDVPFIGKPENAQFILFVLPLVIVVLQWMMIDYVRRRFRSDRRDENDWHDSPLH